jgi:hypothetical protein
MLWYCSINWLAGLNLNIPVKKSEYFRLTDFWATLYIEVNLLFKLVQIWISFWTRNRDRGKLKTKVPIWTDSSLNNEERREMTIFTLMCVYKIWDSSVGITTSWKAGVQFPTGTRDFTFLYSVQNGSVAHPASYPMGNVDSFSGGKVTSA